jgi:hypothetical protein
MNARRLKLSAVCVAMLLCNTLFTAWLLSGNAPGVAGAASPLNQNLAAAAATTIPTAFSYQGTLRDASGNLVNGTVNLSLRLYGVVTGGNPLYSEDFANVNVRSGLFTVIVGDAQVLPASVFNTFPLYIGIKVNNDAEMLPRQRMHPVPYAMQSSSAQNAVTADNLAPGGGVPNLVTLGSGGASEITFLPNNGKITNDANGLALTVGSNKTVTVNGSLVVNGAWNAGAIHDVGDSNGGPNVTKTYPVDIRRYVVEAPDKGTAPTTVPISDTILNNFCADADGCTVSLYMRNWDGTKPGLLAGVSGYRMALSAPNNVGQRQWSVHDPSSNGVTGLDNNGAAQNLMNIYNACIFTDGAYVNGGNANDSAVGFGLLNWYGTPFYESTAMTCVLIIED